MELLKKFALGKIPNEVCKNHTAEILHYLFRMKPWALKMLDSTAKFPVGIKTGNLIHYGNMAECMSVEAEEDFGKFSGRHCMVHFPIKIGALPNLEYQWGVCIPSSCSANDLQEFLTKTFHVTATVNNLECHSLHDVKPYSSSEIATLGIIGFLIVLGILSTIYDCCTKGDKNLLLLSFSFRNNIKNLLNTDAPPQPLDFLNGMRVFAISLVIISHVYMTKLTVRNDINSIKVIDWLSDWGHTWLTSRGILVDCFLVMGGLLACYTFLKNRDRGIKFSLIQYWIHRYMRMAPALAMLLMFEATLMNRLGSGPGWNLYAAAAEKSCKENWWQHVLFINNWWGIEKCMEHTWYLAADMQLNLLAPILLVPLHRRPRVGLALSLAVVVGAFFLSFGLSMGYEEKVDLIRNARSQIERKLYKGTYNRVTPWVMGCILGYFLYRYRYMSVVSTGAKSSTVVKERLFHFLLGCVLWTIPFTLAIGTMVAVHPFIQPDYTFNNFESALYLSLGHIVVAIAMTVNIILCWIGYGGPFYTFFTWRLFVPLSRLSYCIYLIHLVIIKVRLGDVQSTTYLTDYQLVMHWLSCMLFAVFTSPSLYLLVEYPFTVIEMVLQHKPPSIKTEPGSSASYGTLSITTQSRQGVYINNAFELSETSNNNSNNNNRKPE